MPRSRNPRRRRARKGMSSKPTKSFAKKVMSVLNKNVEDKQAFTTAFNSFNSGMTTAPGDILQLIPNITNGTLDNQRVGDQIRGKVLSVKGWVSMTLSYLTAASSARIGVRMLVVQPKTLGDLTNIQANTGTWLSQLLKKGGATTAFSGAVSDLQAPINTDAITKYYDKTFILTLPYVQTAVGEATTFNSVKLFKFTRRLRNKLIRYDAAVNSGLTPTSFNPVLLIGYVHLDGSAADTINTQIQMNYDSIFTYQDA